MSEDFLARWSRRKQAAQAAEPARPPPDREGAVAPEPTAGPGAPESRAGSGAPQDAADVSRESAAPAFDPASLPAIESITPETDIRAFIAAGVPAELTRAALRRVWTSDPRIRDFVGLADYDWDFNQPGSMAGFGPLEGADALRVEAARWVGPVRAEDSPDSTSGQVHGDEPAASAPNISDGDRFNHPTEIAVKDEPSQEPRASQAASQEGDGLTKPAREHTAMQQQQKKREDTQSVARRRHGRALPDS
jgi:hypothetical protein